MLIDKTKDLDDTEAACPLDFVYNVHFQSYNEVSIAKHQILEADRKPST